jgi:hypothetical protein
MRKVFFLLILPVFALLVSCGKQETGKEQNARNDNQSGFSWKEMITVKEIPSFPIKGMIDGNEIKFEYINFEIWRGSNDHVLNFSDRSPKNKCGFIEGNNAFHLTGIGKEFEEGEFIKESFAKALNDYNAEFTILVNGETVKKSPAWNCALVLTDIGDEVVKGRIAMCFKDDKKSWVAGSFEATVCNN